MAESRVGLWAIYVGVLVATVVTQTVVGYWVYTRQWDRDGARWFLLMLGTGLLLTAAVLVFLLPVGPLFSRVSYVVGAFSAILTVGAFVVFVSTYTGNDLHRKRAVQGLFGAAVVVYLVLAPTSGSHQLLFANFEMVAEPFPYLVVERGPVFAAIIVLIQVPAAYGIYLMVNHLLATRRRSSVQLTLFIIGALSIMTLDAISQYTSVFPLRFSHAAFGLLPFYLLTAVSLFRFGLLDVRPVARNTVIEDLRDPVLVVDDRQRVVDFNEAATHVWPGISDEVPAAFERVCPALSETVTVPPGDEDTTEQLSLTYDGQERHYSVTVSAVSKSSREETGWYSILLRDITELEQSRWQLQKQNERLDQVASTISHDLRNPINVTTGRLELIETRIDALDIEAPEREQLHEEVESVEDATDRMEDIIDDVLTLAREGKTVDETEPVALEATARDAWANVDTHDATLSVADDRRLQADRSKLLTIFENCFRNALDHGPDDVTVEVGPTVDGFYVADDGPGIAPKHADSVFEYGYTTSDGGTGLGLSIVKTMAESHGWTVTLDRDYDRGTRLVFAGFDGERWSEPAMAEPSD
ncbi:sensor histidine kinase [Halorientalis regularis]|uniref:histidine kinase n=1 Tax=Halorientalis regularis TaxID=660518 RepID=A0A1G7Q0J2_9EURY|nr:histidine kinase N-terminal 7TM domain-containing protein [Halorientalis regularis]SDF92026.1 His Kinase A (phospho-acceptor) domain-containing protein [Halorientalis regularis]